MYLYTKSTLPLGGSTTEPLLESVEGKFGHLINPGDPVITFTSTYRKNTLIASGIYRGVIRAQSRHYKTERYVVERPDGKKTLLQYNGMVPPTVTLQDLDGRTI
jgi:hypothetical protein